MMLSPERGLGRATLLLLLTAPFFLCITGVLGAPAVEGLHEKWIVFSPSTRQLLHPHNALASLSAILEAEPEWRAVVVCAVLPDGHDKAHARASIFASHDEALKTKSSAAAPTSGGVPLGNTRRMMGYLFAIKHGAKYIFDGDLDAVHIPRGLDSLVAPGGSFAFFDKPINPYAYYGQPALWPHGLPIDVANFIGKVNSTTADKIYQHIGPSERTGPLIRQTIYDGFPDMDPLAHLTRLVSPNVTFARQRIPPLLYGHAAQMPLSIVGTLFHHDAFWALPLPAGSAAVLRGLWAQRVLAEMLPGPLAGISFHAPIARRSAAGASSFVGSFSRPGLASLHTLELTAAVKIAQSVEAVSHATRFWQPPANSPTVREVAAALAHDLGEGGQVAHWDGHYAAQVAAFLEDLADLGYVFPAARTADSMTTAVPTTVPPTTAFATPAPAVPGIVTAHFVRLSVDSAVPPAVRDYLLRGRQLALTDPSNVAAGKYVAFSTHPHEVPQLTATVSMLWRDSLVMKTPVTWDVLVNGSYDKSPLPVLPVCEGIPMSGPWPRPKILFVVNAHWNREVDRNANLSSTSPNTTQNYLLNHIYVHYFNTPFDVVFVGPGHTRHGFLGNEFGEGGYRSWLSLTVAAKKYPNYDGYFLVNDDMVLVQPQFHRYSFFWRWQFPWTVGNQRHGCRPGHSWAWNHAFCPPHTAAFKEMCADKFRGDCGGVEGIYIGQADGFYIPRSMINEWFKWSDVMHKHGSFLEMAVPTIVNSLMPDGMPCSPPPIDHAGEGRMMPLTIPLCTSWGGDRHTYEETYVNERDGSREVCGAFHPIKLTNRPSAALKMKQYLQRHASSDCHRPPCNGRYTLDADGLLWHWNDA